MDMKLLGLRDDVLKDRGSLRIYLSAGSIELVKQVKGWLWGTKLVFQNDLMHPINEAEDAIDKKKRELEALELKLSNLVDCTIAFIKTVEPNVFDGKGLVDRLKSKIKTEEKGDSKPKTREVTVALTPVRKPDNSQQQKGKNNNGQHNNSR